MKRVLSHLEEFQEKQKDTRKRVGMPTPEYNKSNAKRTPVTLEKKTTEKSPHEATNEFMIRYVVIFNP